MASSSFARRHPVGTVLLGLLVLLLAAGGWWYVKNNNGKGLKSTLVEEGKELLPTLENTNLAIRNITPDSLKAQVKLDLRNNMPVTLRIDSFRYQTRIDGDLLTQGAKDRPTVLHADSLSHIDMPLNLDLSKVKDKIKTSQQDCVTVQLAMDLYTRLPVAGTQKIPVTISKRVYVPKLPKIELADVDVTDLGLKNGEAIARFRITNYNPFPITIKQVNYRFRVGGDDMDIRGTETKDVTFNERGTEIMPVHIRFQPKALPKVAFKTLFKAKKTPYDLTGAVLVAAGRHNPEDMKVNFNTSGTLKDLKEIPQKK
ncbi:LEA type 2 family protein [Hymenobacter weizhouensis]|uniref:LEA type 2 family protein n=1 Tax=Hymenobacter sp. YIM 151500-1 TaxID=2987689 RepID=UPI002227636A|nr:LEA type 2 family protein [Hymenobacter sp. YIM 151500-1]UYZ62531.1 LEA type 2 family protein [Hymenobacter sp. YIM 151500-1]